MIIVFVLSALNSTMERNDGSDAIGRVRTEGLSSDGPRPVVCGNYWSRIKKDGYVPDWEWFPDPYPSSFFWYYCGYCHSGISMTIGLAR